MLCRSDTDGCCVNRNSAIKAFMKQVDRYFAKTTFAFTVRGCLSRIPMVMGS